MIFDWVCLIIIVLLSFWGMFRGLLKEFRQKAGIIIGLLTAVLFTGSLTQSLSNLITQYRLGIWGSVIIAVILIGIGYLCAKFLVRILERIFTKFNMQSVDHFLGAIFGALEGLLIVVVIIYVLRLQNVIPREYILAESIITERLKPIMIFLIKFDLKAYADGLKVVL